MTKEEQKELVHKVSKITEESPEEFLEFTDKFAETIAGHHSAIKNRKGIEVVAGLLFFGYELHKAELRMKNADN